MQRIQLIYSTLIPPEFTFSIDIESESSTLSSTFITTSSFAEPVNSTYDSFSIVTETETVCNKCTESSLSDISATSVTPYSSALIFSSSLIPSLDKSSYVSSTKVSFSVISSSISIDTRSSLSSSSSPSFSSSVSSFKSSEISSYYSSLTSPIPEDSVLTAPVSSSTEATDCDSADNTGDCSSHIDTPSLSIISSYPLTITSNTETIETDATQSPETVIETCSNSNCQHSYVSLTTPNNKEVADSTSSTKAITTSFPDFSEAITPPADTTSTTLLTTQQTVTTTGEEETCSEVTVSELTTSERESASEATTQPEYPTESVSTIMTSMTSMTSISSRSTPLELTKTFGQDDFTVTTVSNFGNSNKELSNINHILFSLLSILFFI
ncbi:hypothetical protein B5S28_g603 [[Candida] boidinii]|nr:hypothetical protein B5S28_g603 [[Candida] boidinii]